MENNILNIGPETTIEELNRLGLLSRRATNVCNFYKISTYRQLASIDKKELLSLRNCGLNSIKEYENLKEKYPIEIDKDEQVKERDNHDIEEVVIFPEPTENEELKEAKKKYSLLSLCLKHQLVDWIKERYKQLNIRAKHTVPTYYVMEEILPVLYSDKQLDLLSVWSCGKKTVKEIEKYLEDVKQYFEEISKDIDLTSEIQEIDDFERDEIEIGRSYPFLSAQECKSIAEFKQNTGLIPFLYIQHRSATLSPPAYVLGA